MILREKIVNAETGEETFRDFTDEEIKLYEAEKLLKEKKVSDLEADQTIKAEKRLEILNRLGLSAEEAQLLLGGN
jgi:competence protein ComGC